MTIGVFDSSLPAHTERTAEQAVIEAHARGLAGIMFGDILKTVPELATDRLEAIAQAARQRSLTISAGVGVFNPANPKRSEALVRLGGGDSVAGLAKVIRAMPHLGAKTLFFVVGMIEDRNDPAVAWKDQLAGIVTGVRALEPAIRETGVRLLIKTHEEISSFEILSIIDAVGPDLLGIAHDPVNVACRMEDALSCTQRIAPHIEQVHVDDAYLTFDGPQMRRYLSPMGTGDLDWPAILSLVPNKPVWVEFHRGQFAMPVFDRDWLADQKDMTLDEYRSLLASALRHSQAAAPVPDQVDVFKRLAPTLAWLQANSAGKMARAGK